MGLVTGGQVIFDGVQYFEGTVSTIEVLYRETFWQSHQDVSEECSPDLDPA